MRWTITVPGDVVPKARARPTPGTKKRPRTPERTRVYEQRVAAVATEARVAAGEGPVAVEIRVWRSTRRAFDLDNAAKAVLDGLVRAGRKVLADDRVPVVVDKRIRWEGVDRGEPRTEVTITTEGEQG